MPHIVVRSITPDEIDDFLFVTRTVFAFPGGSLSPIQPQNTLAVFEDGDLVSTFNAWPFQWQLNGATINVAGISSVGTLPHRRRRGHLRRIITEAFRRQRQAGQSMSILWGSHAAIYQRFGYAVVAHDAAYQVHPRDIAFAVPPGLPTGPDSGPDTGAVQLSANPRPGSDRFDTLRAVYGAYIAGRTGEVQRDPGMWERGVLREDPREGPVYAGVYAQDHQAQGYALYTVRDGIYDERLSKHREPDESQRLTLRELVARTPAAYAALWRHIAAHDIVRWIHYENAPERRPPLRPPARAPHAAPRHPGRHHGPRHRPRRRPPPAPLRRPRRRHPARPRPRLRLERRRLGLPYGWKSHRWRHRHDRPAQRPAPHSSASPSTPSPA